MTQPAAVLDCPKCTAPMRSYERNGVTIDQCTSCKGVFLDRGELERLIDAEGSFYDGRASAPPVGPAPQPYQERYRDDRYAHGGKRRKGFLSELFD